ncbi:DUF3782 domain-containing protein [Candidatus Korarchaeum cryptofilum]|jgi:hypothetical protein|uniref:DUF3782 domain-containing protein n=1 Tax=Candidatus Korarchaeum cryptofilum TaxID=498846 RepID=UPI001F3F3ED5|nr:DUF3782 domain-containing protein [Candidatus Korarchaeum cryptofilum]
MTLSPEEKKFLESLKKDEEFRYAVAGILGYSEILERITSIEERIVELEERIIKLEERFARLEERFARLEEEMISFRRLIVVIAHRFGVISEESFREGLRLWTSIDSGCRCPSEG